MNTSTHFYCGRYRHPNDKRKHRDFPMCLEELREQDGKLLCPFHGEQWQADPTQNKALALN